jgi:hypothetical protein
MSLGRQLSLDASATLGSDDRGVTRSRREHEPIAWPHRDTSAVSEDEIDRPARAVENLREAVLVLAVRISRRIRPPVNITSFAAQRSLDYSGIGRSWSVVPTMLDLHGCRSSANQLAESTQRL